jgi:hypothetical protein
MRAAVILAIVGVSVLSAAPVAAQSIPPAVEAACNADYKKLCSNIVPGGGRIIACMKAKDSQLSTGCRTALQDEEKKRAGGK